ncbi:putative orotate phosphoribosyltransferase [Ostertagia ostertagi]
MTAQVLCDIINAKDLKYDYVVGVPYAALPLATHVSHILDVPMLMKRKESKAYGTKKTIEGVFTPGHTVLLIEDVVTSGESIRETAEALRAEGLEVTDSVAVLDRQQGAAEGLARADINFHSLNFSLMTVKKDVRSKAFRAIRSSADAIAYFEANHRVRGYDMQVQRAHALSWNCDGTRLACGSQDRRVSVGTVDSSCRVKCTFVGQGHDDSVDQVAFHRTNPNLLASASTDKSIIIWDIRQQKTHTRLSTRAANLYGDPWSHVEVLGFIWRQEDRLHVIDGRTLSTLKSYESKTEMNEFAYHPSGKYLFVATGQGRVEIFKMPDLELVRTVVAHSGQSNCVALAVSPDGQRVAVGASDALCSIWSIEEMICERNLGRLDYPVRAVAFSSDSQLIATGSEDHSIDIAYVNDGSRYILYSFARNRRTKENASSSLT